MQKKEKNKNYLHYDIADEIMKDQYSDKYLQRKEFMKSNIHITETNIINENNPYQKAKGQYVSIQFQDLQNREDYQITKEYLQKYIKKIMGTLVKKKKPKILIVGIGNEDYAPDALGPKVIRNLNATYHLDLKNIQNKVACIIPGVMALTGLESASIVKGVAMENKIDIVFVIDSLATTSIERLNHVIQITDTGIDPGSGVKNYRQSIDQEYLSIPVISIGVGTVISLYAILYNFIEKDVNNIQKDIPNIMVTSKEIELRIHYLTNIIAEALNLSLNPKLVS